MVLTVIDWFSKMVHFISLPKLPSAKETAEAFLRNKVYLHGFPIHAVSDQGPKFIFRFFHLQSNGKTERLNYELEK